MKGAVVRTAGQPPVYGEFPDPTPQPDEVQVQVHAAALSNLVRSRASGRHYSSRSEVPFVVGIDGAGQLEDGRRVYFLFPRPPYGSMSERTVVAAARTIELPADLDDVTAAAIGNPGMASWVALRERARFARGESVLINGATGSAGLLAVQVAKYLGARKIVATGRSAASLEHAARWGANVTIPLGAIDDEFEAAVQTEFRDGGIDVVLDYLWGPSAERIIAAGAKASENAVRVRYVHVGSLTAPTISLESAALRASGLEIMGSGIGSVPPERIVASLGELMRATVPGGFQVQTRVLPLGEVDQVWSSSATIPRIVFRIP